MRTTPLGIRALIIGVAAAVTFTIAPMTSANAAPKTQTTQIDAQTKQAIEKTKAQPAVQEASKVAQADPRITKQAKYDVKDLDAQAIATYGQYMIPKGDGTVDVAIPARFYFSDAKGAWAATRAANRSNEAVRHQLDSMKQAGQPAELKAYTYGQPIPMGPHANFTPLWWGMVFTFDSVAAEKINKFVKGTEKAMVLIDFLKSLGVVMGPEVEVIINGIAMVLRAIAQHVESNITPDGLVIKSLWLPILWCEKPTGPFVPAPPLPGKKSVKSNAPNTGLIALA